MPWIQYTDINVIIHGDSSNELATLPLTATNTEVANAFFAVAGAQESSARWVEFGGAVQASQLINQLLGTALQQVPALGLGLGVGLGKAADGDARVFLNSWTITRSLGLVSPELLAEVVALARQFDLPAEFVAELQLPVN